MYSRALLWLADCCTARCRATVTADNHQDQCQQSRGIGGLADLTSDEEFAVSIMTTYSHALSARHLPVTPCSTPVSPNTAHAATTLAGGLGGVCGLNDRQPTTGKTSQQQQTHSIAPCIPITSIASMRLFVISARETYHARWC